MEHTITIQTEEEGKRIEQVAAQRYAGQSRSQWSAHGQFWLDDVAKKGKTKVEPAQIWRISLVLPDSSWQAIPAWDNPLTVLHDAPSYAVIQKPTGISCHPSVSEPSKHTVVNALVHQFAGQLADNEFRPGLVHRLDKPTSGTLIIAKTDAALRSFQSMWPEVQKTYLAVVEGPAPEEGTIEANIGRHPQHRTRMAIRSAGEGKSAKTSFVRVWTDGRISLLRVLLHTGRTHQIRVHLRSIGHPVLGDHMYGTATTADRLMLHAHALSFLCPDTNAPVRVVAPPPKAFADLTESDTEIA